MTVRLSLDTQGIRRAGRGVWSQAVWRLRLRPQNRLPLHLAFAIATPGRYSIRWTVVGERFEAGPPLTRQELLAESDWLDFEVVATKPTDRQAWLRASLAASPTETGAYVGDYLPSLLAAAPDRRVAQAALDGTYSTADVIASFALASLRLFPTEIVVPLTLEKLHVRGPNYGLAHFISWHAPWFQDRRNEIVGTATWFLSSNDDAVVAAALRLLGFAGAFDWRDGDIALRDADRAVEGAASVLATRSVRVARALAIYLPRIKSAALRDRLWQLIEQRPAEREQALIAVTWVADPRDLSRIGDLLLQSGGKASSVGDLAGLPYHLIRAYGEAAIPYLQRALAESPHLWGRTHSAEQLALKGRVEAFRFFLDAITMISTTPLMSSSLSPSCSGSISTMDRLVSDGRVLGPGGPGCTTSTPSTSRSKFPVSPVRLRTGRFTSLDT